MIRLIDHKHCIHCDGSGRIVKRSWGYTRQRHGRQGRGMHIYVSNHPCNWNALRDQGSYRRYIHEAYSYAHIEERREQRPMRRRNQNKRQGQIRPRGRA